MKLQTLAEKTDFRQTGRTDEVETLCAQFARTWPDAVRCIEYGRSAEGRAMLALIISRAGTLSADEIRQRKLPLLMLQGGIHPGESDGKDAGFIALRELLEGGAAPGVLEKQAILFVPAFNVDGHERFGRQNRPNQIGPEEMGWRATAQNLNLNRDYLKADAPEMQAMLRLIDEWDPLVCADMHVTDGADFEPDISLQTEPVNQGDPQLRPSGVQMRDELIDKLAAQGSLPLPFYPDLAKTDDPASGFHLTVYSPRFSTGYFPQRNRFTVLVETHSWKDYATRVRVTRNTIVGLAELTAQHGTTWLQKARQADATAAALAGKEVELDFAAGWREPTKAGAEGKRDELSHDASDPNVTTIEFRGYAYTRKPSAILGEPVTIYDPKTPQIWRVPFRRNVTPSLIVKAPRGGYLVPAAYAQDIGTKLALHGIAFKRLATRLDAQPVELFRATQVDFSATPFEGRTRAKLHGGWNKQTVAIPVGSLYVPISQPLARLIMALLEPQAPDSFASWGFFNACFEQKEYMEPYVAEQVAQQMLDANPALRKEFEDRLRQDAAFAENPGARLDFFFRRHASWDDRYNLYPVYRVETSL